MLVRLIGLVAKRFNSEELAQSQSLGMSVGHRVFRA